MKTWMFALLTLSLTLPVALADTGPLRLLIPMYFYPHSDDPEWQAIAEAAQQVDIIAIVNPGNGLQEPLSDGDRDNYNQAQNLLHNAGVKMIGYVSSNYGCESLEEVKSHVDQYFNDPDFAYITGIFVDETENDLGNDDGNSPCPGIVDTGFDYAAYYHTISEHIRGYGRFDLIVFNPGTDVPDEYLEMADVILSFESRGGYFETDMTGATQLSTDARPENYAALIYDTNALGRAAIDEWLTLAVERHYGYVHFTDDHGWSALPSYFHDLVQAVACVNSGNACNDESPDAGDEEPASRSGGGIMLLSPALLALCMVRRRSMRARSVGRT